MKRKIKRTVTKLSCRHCGAMRMIVWPLLFTPICRVCNRPMIPPSENHHEEREEREGQEREGL